MGKRRATLGGERLFTQEEAAEISGLSRGRVSELEMKAIRKISQGMANDRVLVQMIAEKFEIDPDEVRAKLKQVVKEAFA